MICDGIHIHPATVRQTFKMFGDDRIIMISDSMEATGMPDGEYALGGQKVIKKRTSGYTDRRYDCRFSDQSDGLCPCGSAENADSVGKRSQMCSS